MRALGIHHVADAHHSGGRERAFVDGAENIAVIMRIEQAGRNVLALTVNYHTLARKISADRLNAAAGDEHVRVGEDALRTAGPNSCAFDQDYIRRCNRPTAIQR